MAFLIRNLANLFTLANLFLGFIGIINVIEGQLETGCYLLFGAALFDLLDGFVARLTKTTSKIGEQLDSLSDVVSFGVLPAMIMVSLMLKTHREWVYIVTVIDIPLVSLIPFILAAGAAIRLARFNLHGSKSDHFSGLPTPAMAIFVASLPLIIKNDLYIQGYHTFYIGDFILNPYVLLGISIVLTWLMLSKITIMSFKFKDFSWNQNYLRYSLVIIFIVLLLLFSLLSIPLTIIIYVLMSIIFKNKLHEVLS
jgi:CDP-diacylglycerol---serine O-phosphatidyltransferase